MEEKIIELYQEIIKMKDAEISRLQGELALAKMGQQPLPQPINPWQPIGPAEPWNPNPWWTGPYIITSTNKIDITDFLNLDSVKPHL
jgi:hypothetical protein